MGPGFIRRCTHGVAGYVVVRCLTTIIAFICELTDTYHEGVISAKGAYVYLAVITNLSQAVAMWVLLVAGRWTLQPRAPPKGPTGLSHFRALAVAPGVRWPPDPTSPKHAQVLLGYVLHGV